MSFSGDVKRELCRNTVHDRCCAQAEAYGVLLFCNSFTGREIRIVTESEHFAKRLPQLFHRAFRVEFDQRPDEKGSGKFLFGITDQEKLKSICQVYGHDPAETVALHINFGVLEEDCCRLSFCRGAFLAGGSVTDPEKGYHLELATSHYNVSREFQALLREIGFEAGETTRKSNYVTYFKHSGAIEDVLTTIGAPVAAMQVMNAKVEKHLRNGVNRRVNCDAANLDKTVEAAQEQLEAIRKLEARGDLESLPQKLRQTAQLRRENPELTLSQLAALCQPPVTKSALNHRLRKLMELADQ